MSHIQKYIGIIILVFLSDLLSKVLVRRFFVLNIVENKGISFGINSPMFITISISIVIIFFLIYWFLKEKQYSLPLSLIIGGALGNLFERIFFSRVTDFISIYSFPSFNVADTFITIGFIILIWMEFVKNKHK